MSQATSAADRAHSWTNNTMTSFQISLSCVFFGVGVVHSICLNVQTEDMPTASLGSHANLQVKGSLRSCSPNCNLSPSSFMQTIKQTDPILQKKKTFPSLSASKARFHLLWISCQLNWHRKHTLMRQYSFKGTRLQQSLCRVYLEAVHLAASQGSVSVSGEAAGPLKAKMVSYKLQFLPSVSFLPLRDHRAFKIGPELTSHREKAWERGDGEGSAWKTWTSYSLQHDVLAMQ